MAKIWDESDNEFLRENYMKFSNQELADRFEVSKKSIQGKLRRLGLHRGINSMFDHPEESNLSEIDDEKESILKFRPKRLSIIIPKPATDVLPKVRYVQQELTERRKRAVREFDNAMQITQSGDLARGIQEFDFIITTFANELDIVERSKLCKKIYLKEIPGSIQEAETAEEHYLLGIWYHNHCAGDQAMTEIQKALDLEPDYIDAAFSLACMKCKQGDFESSIKLIERVLDLDEFMSEVIISDDDLEPLWDDERFLDLIRDYVISE
jgi:tetratricopeptide (TPR) repeat protein